MKIDDVDGRVIRYDERDKVEADNFTKRFIILKDDEGKLSLFDTKYNILYANLVPEIFSGKISDVIKKDISDDIKSRSRFRTRKGQLSLAKKE